jgi:hypothetical protein
MSEKLEFVENYLLTHDDYLEEERNEIKHNFSPFKSEQNFYGSQHTRKRSSFISVFLNLCETAAR